jgi:hypothetical protein
MTDTNRELIDVQTRLIDHQTALLQMQSQALAVLRKHLADATTALTAARKENDELRKVLGTRPSSSTSNVQA